MESFLGFKEPPSDVVGDLPHDRKLVPWISWQEWNFVRDSLFSSSPHSIASALKRISAWRSRGCLPVVIEVTASIIEIQQKDPSFSAESGCNALESEEMLSMLYCMAIMRLVNGVVEKSRKKNEISIAEAADIIGLPRMLIDIRHEGSHRDLPSLRLVRRASVKALEWLKSYYWEPQSRVIPSPSLRKEIKSQLRELALCLKIKQATRSKSSEKRVKQYERLGGRSKFLSLVSGKLQSTKFAGSKKNITKTLKSVLRLFSTFQSEVVSVLLEFLLKASGSLDLDELPKENQVNHNTNNLHSAYHDWKSVVAKLSNKEPELLVSLLNVVLQMIESQESTTYEPGEHFLQEYKTGNYDIEKLSNLFEWLVGHLKGLRTVSCESSAGKGENSLELNLSEATLAELLRKCLLMSSSGNAHLKASAIVFAHMIGNRSMTEKLNKFCSLDISNPDVSEENFSLGSPENFISREEKSIRQAAEELELLKLQRMKIDTMKTTETDGGNRSRWALAKSWNPCPIGMLPQDIGSSGYIPVLDCDDFQKEDPNSLGEQPVLDCDDLQKEVPSSLGGEEYHETNQHGRKREADCDVEILDDSSLKKLRNEVGFESDDKEDSPLEGVKGQLMIGGIWRKVGNEELLGIASDVRILV